MLKTITFKIITILFIVVLPALTLAQEQGSEFRETIEKADKYFDEGDYINAKASYQYAVKLNPDDAYAKERLEESIDLIRVQMEKSQEYAAKTLIADDLMSQGDLEAARKVYVEASTILPGDPYAKEKIDEIDRLVNEQKMIEAGYQSAINKADKAFKDQNYQDALKAYKEATSFKPDDSYANQKVSETELIIKQLQANAGEYENALALAEQFVERKNYPKAVEQLQLAIDLKPEEQAPKSRLEEVKEEQEAYEAYSKIVSTADELYIYKDFEKAKVKYEEALRVNPNDSYVKNMIDRIDIALADIKQLNQSSYEMAIQIADELFSQQDYEKAIEEYRKALTFRPDADYAQKKIEEINEVIALRQKQDEAYRQSIARADKLFDEEDYEAARNEYLIARDLKPIEQYPKVKIGEIDDLLAALQTKEENYTSLVAGADKLFYSDDYEESRAQYRKALTLFPDRKYPQDQITMINEIIGIRDTYIKAVTQAERLLDEDDLEGALLAFREAAEVDPDKEYPREKITELEILIEERKEAEALELKYRNALSKADDLYRLEQWDEADEAYRAALALKPEEKYPLEQLQAIENKKAELAAAVARFEEYETTINQADDLLDDEDYEAALENYRKAAELQPDRTYPGEKIEEINNILEAFAAAKIIDEQYDEVIALGDKHFGDEEWNNALTHYNAALNLKPGEQYPRDQIDEINRILNEIAIQKQVNEDYSNAIEEGDVLYAENNLRGALELYEKAAELKPEGTEHESRLTRVNTDINRQLAEEELEKEYLAIIQEADAYFEEENYQDAILTYNAALQRKADEDYPRKQIEEANKLIEEKRRMEQIQAQYDELIAQGDEFFAEQSYRQATLAYREASELKPEETYPLDQIATIEGLLAEIAAAKELDENYSELIAEGDKFLEREKYNEAIGSYEEALALKPGETYPQGRIDEINALLEEIRKAEELQSRYDALIAQADGLFEAQNYVEALSPYQDASQLKPEETYPQERIGEINAIIAAAKELERQYAEFITKGDNLFGEENYDEAIENYTAAIELKPEENYPKDKIAEINGILAQLKDMAERQEQYDELIVAADSYFNQEQYNKSLDRYQQASALFPEEAYPRQKIEEITGILDAIAAAEELEKNYRDLIWAGDNNIREEVYDSALVNFQMALELKPDEKYPTEKIDEINDILAGQARLAKLEADYQAAITEGDSRFEAEDYEAALASFNTAVNLKPKATYPRDKINEIEGILAEIAERENIQAQYNEAIAFADKHYSSGDYENAILEYKRANAIKPDEEYPLNQIAEIEGLLADLEQNRIIEENYTAAIERADESFRTTQYQEALIAYQEAQNIKPEESYPGDQIIKIKRQLEAQQAEKEKVYALAITKADNYYQQEQWEMAKMHYESASEVKPGETYPLDRIKEVNEEILKKRQLMQDEYDKAIADADKFYAGKIYDEAIDAYRKAAEIFPSEEYPEVMIRKILKFLSDHSIVQINSTPILIENTTTQKFDFLPVPVQDRKGNYLYFRARNMSDEEHKVIIRYGSGGTMNGGVVVRIPESDRQNEFIVRISKQDKWFRADNDWITMYPEGGDVEVSLIQISYSD
jgi:tetratricopeptide (TPR) repeat protein